MTELWLVDLAERLVRVPGIVGVTLGGSRARGEHSPDSDVDLGIYYRAPLDVEALARLAREVAGPAAEVTGPGDWGPWVDGGAWLTIDDQAVDWIYRDLDRVHDSWDDAQRGDVTFHSQVGHPLGVPGFAYAGEIALGVVLADPTGELTRLHEETAQYPRPLAEALVARLWEARFLLGLARKTVGRADTTYVAGCLFRVVELCAHALHGRVGRWLVNEKSAVTGAGRLACAPRDFAARAQHLMGTIGDTPAELVAALGAAEALIDETAAACGGQASIL